MYDLDNLFVIAVDGLDVSGKETFSKSLYKTMVREMAEKLFLNVKISMVSFPRYNTPIGVEIKEMLNKDINSRDIKELGRLFEDDRIEYFRNYIQNEYEENMMNVIICDRYSYANLIYKYLKIINVEDKIQRAVEAQLIESDFLNEFKYIPKPDITILFNRTDSKSAEIHRELIKNKSKKDQNEKEFIQSYLSDVMNNELIDPISKTTKELLMVPIGSNFGSDKLEIAISMKVVSEMVKLKMDRILYPSVVVLKDGETDKKINGKDIAPSVRITASVDKETLTGTSKANLIEALKYIFNTYNKTVTSNKIELKPLYEHYKYALEIFDIWNRNYDCKNKVMHTKTLVNPKNTNLLVDSGFMVEFGDMIFDKLEMDMNSMITSDPEEMIDRYMEEFLFIPRKDSKLASPYTIYSPISIELKPNEIKEVPLLIFINKIEGLTRKTKNAIIDIDIRTSRQCVLNYGVSVADSPSALPCDYKGELSIVLVNLTSESVTIPVGAPLASMLIKRSSCETEFALI